MAALRAEIFRNSSCCSALRFSEAMAEIPIAAAAERPLSKKVAIKIIRMRRTLAALRVRCSGNFIGGVSAWGFNCFVVTAIDAALRLEIAPKYGAIIDRAVAAIIRCIRSFG